MTVGLGTLAPGVPFGVPRQAWYPHAVMCRRERFVPVLLVTLLLVGVCAVTLAHADTGDVDTCTATAKSTALSASTSPADIAAILADGVALAMPTGVATGLPACPATLGREALIDPRAPRAPPAA